MTEKVFPQTVAEVLAHMEQEWTALQSVLARLDEDQMTSPGHDGWSVKDELAHLAAWANGLAALVQKRPRYTAMGLPPNAAPHTVGIERMNQMIFEQNRHLPVAAVRARLQEAHERAAAAISLLDDGDLMRPYDDFQPQDQRPDGQKPILNRIIGNTFGHYAEHREIIEAAFPSK